MTEVWNGINVDFWAQGQTINRRAERGRLALYSGFDLLDPMYWSDFMDPIPLEIRYASFCRRLAKALSRGRT